MHRTDFMHFMQSFYAINIHSLCRVYAYFYVMFLYVYADLCTLCVKFMQSVCRFINNLCIFDTFFEHYLCRLYTSLCCLKLCSIYARLVHFSCTTYAECMLTSYIFYTAFWNFNAFYTLFMPFMHLFMQSLS
jgi:hypothetical protein